jgi:hypothetical protein
VVPCNNTVFPFYVGEGGQDPDHLVGGVGERRGQLSMFYQVRTREHRFRRWAKLAMCGL